MKRKIIHIDETLCNGCGLCIPNCHEGALRIIDGKARLVSDLFCDGLGACLGHCPEGAIAVIEREAEPYDEWRVMEQMVPKGRNTILAHLDHLRDHGEEAYLDEAIRYLKEHDIDMSPSRAPLSSPEGSVLIEPLFSPENSGCGCLGSAEMNFRIDQDQVEKSVSEFNSSDRDKPKEPGYANKAPAAGFETTEAPSELRQWPVQLHLLSPQASFFRNADVVLAADCVAFTMGNFHNHFLKGKALAIACPKLDSNKESYIEKLSSMIADTGINSLTVVMMEVPCCGSLLGMADIARKRAGKDLPIRKVIVGIKGEIQSEVVV